jgi:hypothetical protein
MHVCGDNNLGVGDFCDFSCDDAHVIEMVDNTLYLCLVLFTAVLHTVYEFDERYLCDFRVEIYAIVFFLTDDRGIRLDVISLDELGRFDGGRFNSRGAVFVHRDHAVAIVFRAVNVVTLDRVPVHSAAVILAFKGVPFGLGRFAMRTPIHEKEDDFHDGFAISGIGHIVEFLRVILLQEKRAIGVDGHDDKENKKARG